MHTDSVQIRLFFLDMQDKYRCVKRLPGLSHDRFFLKKSENIIRTIGQNIKNTGGYITLQASYYTLLHIMRPLLHMNHEKYIQSWNDIKFRVSKCWDGVGEWRH